MKTPGIKLIGPWTLHAGHGFGLKGPFLTGHVRWPEKMTWDMQEVLQRLSDQNHVAQPLVAELKGCPLDLVGFFRLVYALEVTIGNPFAQLARVLDASRKTASFTDYRFVIASQHANGTVALLQWLIANIHRIHKTTNTSDVDQMLSQLLVTAKSFANSVNARGVNYSRIIKAALALDMPVKLLPGTVILVGTGCYAQYFRSTITQRTTSLGVYIAKKKSLTAQYLRLHGLPTPQHKSIRSGDIEAAVSAARHIGFPVVVKPDDRDGGVGVYAGLMNEQQFRQCLPLASQQSPNLLVEQHIEGNDYRITVIDGEVVKVIGRRPGGITGDGTRSVREIIASDLAVAMQNTPGKKSVELDQEALALLTEAGLTPESVLPAGAFQVLRRRANMSTGGTSRDVRDIIHPDNERLAIQAAQALKLDIAGIDLITPDIGRSWMEVKSAICEVNAQPQISTEFADDVYVNLLRQRLPVHTRMRTVLLVNFDELATGQTDLEYVEAELIRQGERVLCIKENGTWLAGTKIAPSGDMSISRAAINAELNPSATALLICLSFQTVLADGIPWQKIDHICWIGLKHLASQSENPKLLQLQSLLQGHLVGPICICAQDIGSSPGPVRGLNFEFLPTLSSGWPMSQRATAALHIENENLA